MTSIDILCAWGALSVLHKLKFVSSCTWLMIRTPEQQVQRSKTIMTTLPICHFNDVYRVTPQKISRTSSETVDVTQFAALLHGLRDQWAQRADGKRDGDHSSDSIIRIWLTPQFSGLVLFSGDVFSPSTESSVTRGSHMVLCIPSVIPLTRILKIRLGTYYEWASSWCFIDRWALLFCIFSNV